MTHWVGIAIVVVPVLLIAAIVLKRPVFLFLLVLTGVGLGYLHTTGAAEDVGNLILVEVNKLYPTGIKPGPSPQDEPVSGY